MNENKKHIIRFTVSVLLISWAIGFGLKYFFPDLGAVFTYTPALIAIGYTAIYKTGWKNLGFNAKHLIYLIPAALIPISYRIIMTLISEKLGYIEDVNFVNLFTSEEIIGTLLTMVFITIMVMGEEVGWRGFMQNRMIKEFGVVKGIILLGIIWGIWHLPVAIYGYNHPDHPYIETFLTYPIACVLGSFIVGWLYYRSQNIFVASTFHHFHNNTETYIFSDYNTINELGSSIVYYGIEIIYAIVFGYLLWKEVKMRRLTNSSHS